MSKLAAVVNTYRQATVRALRVENGLGLAEGSRFDRMNLTPVGRQLADAFLEQAAGRSLLQSWLHDWRLGDREPGRSEQLWKALSPEHPSEGERSLVRGRVLDAASPAAARRATLARVIGRGQELRDVEAEVVPRLRPVVAHSAEM